MPEAPRAAIIVPCFNEERRLDRRGFHGFAAEPVEIIFVDDGSTDGTRAVLEGICKELAAQAIPARSIVLEKNGGKGEAVRRGMLEALRAGAAVVGYYDADLATPPSELSRLVRALSERSVDVALAARVALLGHLIERRAPRHYLGRVFATAASMVLGMPVYDTQCGAKIFRRTPALEAALKVPFSGRWAFDVELLGRLRAGTKTSPGLPVTRFLEMPLLEWRDIAGSTLTPFSFPLLGLELLRIAFALRRWRAS